MEISKASENKPILDFRYIEKQLNNHGLETPETIKLRDKIKKFLRRTNKKSNKQLALINLVLCSEVVYRLVLPILIQILT